MRKIILRIPADRLAEIVNKNIIANAVALSGNAYMKYLWTIWYNYIEPNGTGEIDCMYCLNNVLDNFRSMQEMIVEVNKENQKLASV